jgi:hypothetical protein
MGKLIPRKIHTLTDCDPALIFPQETASSGRAPESEPSNSWPVFCKFKLVYWWVEHHISETQAHDKNRIIGAVPLKYNSESAAHVVSTATNHEHRIRNLVFAHPSTKDNHAGLLGVQ